MTKLLIRRAHCRSTYNEPKALVGVGRGSGPSTRRVGSQNSLSVWAGLHICGTYIVTVHWELPQLVIGDVCRYTALRQILRVQQFHRTADWHGGM